MRLHILVMWGMFGAKKAGVVFSAVAVHLYINYVTRYFTIHLVLCGCLQCFFGPPNSPTDLFLQDWQLEALFLLENLASSSPAGVFEEVLASTTVKAWIGRQSTYCKIILLNVDSIFNQSTRLSLDVLKIVSWVGLNHSKQSEISVKLQRLVQGWQHLWTL